MNETMINAFALIGAISSATWVFGRLKALTAASAGGAAVAANSPSKAEPPPAASPFATAAELSGPLDLAANDDIAVIAAAIHAMLGSSRIVHISNNRGQYWAAEGRWMHQTSHKTH
jgi:hypothetical protein